MRRSLTLGLLLLAGFPLCLHAQAMSAGEGPGPRQLTLTLGVGNTMGWLGGQVEKHLSGERLSIFGGLGYTPADVGGPSGLTGAAGARAFTPGENHRGFLEVSIAQVGVTETVVRYRNNGTVMEDAGQRGYGPGLQAGYQFVSDRGLTFLASAGAGWALGLDQDVQGSAIQPLFGLGVGYTWR